MGTCPPTSATRSSTMRTRSASVKVGLSPVVPTGTRKWMPASTCRRPSRRTAASSRLPVLVNGVTRAVPQPVNGVLMFDLVLDTQHVLHGEPTAPALHPLRRGEGAPRKARPITRHVREDDTFGRAI